MDRTIKYIVIAIILTTSVMTILSATHSSVLVNVLLIGIGAISIVVVLWYLVETLNKRTYSIGKKLTSQNVMKVLFLLLIITAFAFFIISKINFLQARQIEKARLHQNSAIIENH